MHFLVFSQVKCLAWQVSFGQSGGSSLPSRQSGEKSQCFDIGMQFWPSAHLNQSGSWSSHCSICCWPSLFEAFEAKNKVDKTRIKNQERVSWLSHIFVEFCRNFSVKSLFFYPGCVPWFLTHVFKLEKWFDDTVIISNFVVAGNNCGRSTFEEKCQCFCLLIWISRRQIHVTRLCLRFGFKTFGGKACSSVDFLLFVKIVFPFMKFFCQNTRFV